jgi:hypothetical protein
LPLPLPLLALPRRPHRLRMEEQAVLEEELGLSLRREDQLRARGRL